MSVFNVFPLRHVGVKIDDYFFSGGKKLLDFLCAATPQKIALGGKGRGGKKMYGKGKKESGKRIENKE